MAIRAKYKGADGEYLEGIPGSDLDEDQYQALSAEQRKMVRESDIYDTKTDAQMSGGRGADAGGGE